MIGVITADKVRFPPCELLRVGPPTKDDAPPDSLCPLTIFVEFWRLKRIRIEFKGPRVEIHDRCPMFYDRREPRSLFILIVRDQSDFVGISER